MESRFTLNGKIFLVVLSALAGLSACQTASTQSPEPVDPAAQRIEAVTPPSLPVDYQAEPGLTPVARLRKMISFLESGDAARARIELEAYEAAGGDQETVAYWRRQIEGDPDALLEADGTIHKIRPGESLSSISRTFLGDPLQFYLLARFNGIENPSKIAAGQEIRIPRPRAKPLKAEADRAPPPDPPGGLDAALGAHAGSSTEPSPSAPSQIPEASFAEQEVITARSESPPAAESSDAPQRSAATQSPAARQTTAAPDQDRPVDDSVLNTPPEAFDEAAESAEQGQMESAIALLEDGLKRYPGNQKVRRAAVLAYAKHGEALLADDKPEQAAVILAKAADLDPDNQMITKRLQDVRNRIQAEAFYQKGLGLRESGDTEAALAAFVKALEIAPDHQEALDQVATLQTALVDQMQHRAIIALREKDYPTALGLWERILAIDPANGTADRYHKHTIDLLARQANPETE